MDTIMSMRRPAEGAGGLARPGPEFLRFLAAALVRKLLAWRERAEQRAALKSLDDRLLKDIGVSRSDVRLESRKPFWQD